MAHKLLVIDDDAIVRSLIDDYFTPRGWEVLSTVDGAAGLELAAKSKPDAIFLDVCLPDMDGWEVCQRLKTHETLRSVPVVMVSGERKSAEDKVEGLSRGADDYILKPFSPRLLLAKLQTILNPSV